MIKTLLVQMTDYAKVAGVLNKNLEAGFVPMAVCFVPATDGPGALHYVLGKTSDGVAELDGVEHAGNGTAATLPPAEVVDDREPQ